MTMAKKKTPPPVPPAKSLSWGWISLFVLLTVGVGVYAYNRHKETVSSSPATANASSSDSPASPQPAHDSASQGENPSTAPTYRIPPYFEDPSAAGVLLPTKDPDTVTPYARAGYVVAQKDPTLLAQLPCFCYCDRFGHKSLHDCYVSEHAESCDVCLKEAIEGEQMKDQGMTPQEIRSVIIAKYHPHNSGASE
jgi:Protein of unknown function with PCYCGC motif